MHKQQRLRQKYNKYEYRKGDAYGYPSELFKLDMERLGIIPKRKPAKIIDFTRYIDNNRSTNH